MPSRCEVKPTWNSPTKFSARKSTRLARETHGRARLITCMHPRACSDVAQGADGKKSTKFRTLHDRRPNKLPAFFFPGTMSLLPFTTEAVTLTPWLELARPPLSLPGPCNSTTVTWFPTVLPLAST